MANRDAGTSFFQIIFAMVLLETGQGCGKLSVCDVPSAIPDGTQAPWESPAVTRTKKQWESLFDPKNEWTHERSSMFRALDDVFSMNLSEQDLRKLAASANSCPLKSPQEKEFLDYLVSYMIVNFTYAGDRESLVNLLAAKCPGEMYPYLKVEYFIARNGQNKLDAPILVLADAFQKCKEPSVRQKIVNALRRAFAGSGLHWTSDEDFVKKCSTWYFENRAKIVVNLAYQSNAQKLPPYLFEKMPELYEPQVLPWSQSLFKLKPSSEVGASAADKPSKVLPKEAGTSAVATNTVLFSKPGGKNADNGLASLLGTWNLVEEISGEDRTPADTLKGEQYIISNGTMSFIAPRLEKPFDYGLTVCPDAEPHAINLRTGDQKSPKWQWTVRGIYRLNGDDLQICLAPSYGGPRPTEFKTGKPWCERLLTLKRVK